MTRTSSVLCALLLLPTAALAQPAEPAAEGAPAEEAASPPPGDPPPSTSPPPAAEKRQGRGDFDAGGKVRLPSGPDETAMEYGPFNWVALDLYGRYFVLDELTITAGIPLALIKPEFENTVDEAQPKLFGGFTVRPEYSLGKVLGAGLMLGMLRQEAVLLSEKDFPLYVGDLTFAAGIGPFVKFKGLGVDFALQPSLVYQAAGSAGDAVTAVQVPVAASLALSDLLKVSVETGLYTADDFGVTAKDGARLSLGAAVDVRLGKIILHAGAGAASLLVDAASPFYRSIGDSIYFDLNVKYAK